MKHIILCLLCIFSQTIHQTKLYSQSYTNVSEEISNLQTTKIVSLVKASLVPVSLLIGIYFNKKNIEENFKNFPITSIAISLFTSNFLIDSILKYKHINKAINMFMFAKLISKYLLASTSIKNSMIKLQGKENFDLDAFNREITSGTNLSYKELEMLIFELLNSSSHTINNLRIDVNTDISEKIYFLFRENLEIEQIVEITQSESELYFYIKQFQLHPIKTYPKITSFLNKKIKELLKEIFKNK